MAEPQPILGREALNRTLHRMAHEIAERNPSPEGLALIGIHRGGVSVAGRLSQILDRIYGQSILCGSLDVSMHRDDLDQRAPPLIQPTAIPFDISGRTVVLVDDVLFSGRTTRAALDALHDFGRPRQVQLAVLIDRGHRDLPIKADFVGKNLPTASHERVEVTLDKEGAADSVVLLRA